MIAAMKSINDDAFIISSGQMLCCVNILSLNLSRLKHTTRLIAIFQFFFSDM